MSKDALDLLKPSYRPIPGGPRDIPDLVRAAAAAQTDGEAVVDRLRRYSYAELAAAMEAGAAALHAQGVRPGDRVGATAPNHADMLIAFLAVQRLGAIWVGLSKQLAGPELLFQLQDAGVCFFLCDASARAKLEALGDAAGFVRGVIDMEPGDNAWSRLLAAHQGDRAPDIAIDPLAPCAIAYTSGTTGFPKGAVHSQHGLVVVAVSSAGRSAAKGAALRRGATLPMTILNVLAKEGLAALAAGGTFVAIDRVDAVGVAEWIRDERVESIVCSPPTVLDFIHRDEIAPAAMASIQAMTCGGGPCPQTLRDGFMRKFGKPLYVSWGLTEAPASVAGSYTDECPAGASGRVFSHLEVVVRASDGSQAAPGEQGELCVRAAAEGAWAGVYPHMLGYWNRPEQTQSVLRDGELLTGDIGYVDEAGWLFVVDRAKSVIVRGGQNIYPAEIERVLKTHPAVVDAAVIAIPSERFGESALAAIQVASDDIDRPAMEAELRALALRELAKFKCPETWLFLTEVPRNPMMKINRGELRDRCLALLR